MSRPVYAITGIMGCGKSTVGKILEQLGATVIDADYLARIALEPGSPGLAKVVSVFGPAVLTSAGALDRARLAELVFGDDAKLKQLNNIVHPEVRRLFEERCVRAQLLNTSAPIFYLVPLLFEAQVPLDGFKGTIAINCDTATVIERVKVRDGLDYEAIQARLSAQLSNAEKCARADIVLDNLGDRIELQRRVEELYRGLGTD